jgi:hypothetical protein
MAASARTIARLVHRYALCAPGPAPHVHDLRLTSPHVCMRVLLLRWSSDGRCGACNSRLCRLPCNLHANGHVQAGDVVRAYCCDGDLSCLKGWIHVDVAGTCVS